MHHVVVVGGGFGGLWAVKHLAGAPVAITLIDRRNFHLFQPLLYQVATCALSPGEIATPLRRILRKRRDVRVLLGDVVDVDLNARQVMIATRTGAKPVSLAYDTLIVAVGSQSAYFGHDDWRSMAPGLKSLEDALDIRRRILGAFEAAELERDAERRRAWLTFVVVGGGPTGVELAGQIAEISKRTLRDEFREIDPSESRILLVEGTDRILAGFDERLGKRAVRSLEHMGIRVRTEVFVTEVGEGTVVLRQHGVLERLSAETVIWAAGVAASPLGAVLAARADAQPDNQGRVPVTAELTLPGHPEVFAIGDVARVQSGSDAPLPGVAPVATQAGEYVARTVRSRLLGGPTPGPFRYRDRGKMATIGRGRAVVEIGRVRYTGLPARLSWLVLHIAQLIGFENRLLVFIRWCLGAVTGGRGARLMTNERTDETDRQER